MKVLILSPYADLIDETVERHDHIPIVRSETMEVSDWPEADWVVSFGYRKIIQGHTIEKFRGRIINIHLSLLPYNRGADPNFWSWFDGTPKGVTIHRVAPGIDTGDILVQRELHDGAASEFRPPYTLETTYMDLLVAASGLFKKYWDVISKEKVKGKPPTGNWSYHTSREKDKFFNRLPLGWATPVHDISKLGAIYWGKK